MSSAQRVPVLMYHRVGETRNAFERRYGITAESFAAHMRTLAHRGYRAVAAEDLVAWLEGGPPLPERAFVLTFDDGFVGVGQYAAPLLEQLGWPYTVFLVADLLGKTDEWTRSENPDGVTYPLLGIDEIHALAARGASFQSHTRTHPSLPKLDSTGLAEELAGSRKILSELLGRPVSLFAYPYGHLDERVEAAAQAAGYRAAFSTQPGFNRRDINRLRIRRLDIAGTDTPAMLLRKIHLGSNDGSLGHAVRYYLKRLKSRLPGANR